MALLGGEQAWTSTYYLQSFNSFAHSGEGSLDSLYTKAIFLLHSKDLNHFDLVTSRSIKAPLYFSLILLKARLVVRTVRRYEVAVLPGKGVNYKPTAMRPWSTLKKV